jgi:hypothetical protein
LRVALFCLQFFLLSTFVIGQEKEDRMSFIIEMEYGAIAGSETINTGNPSDFLLKYGSYKSYFSPFSASLFFHKNWGVGVRFQLNYFADKQFSGEKINSNLEQRFGSSYFIDNNNVFTPDVTNSKFHYSYFFGIRHRYEIGKVQLMTSLYYGTNEFEVGIYSATLKQKGGNEIIDYDLRSRLNDSSGENFLRLKTLMPTVQVGYALTPYLYLNANLNYSIAFSDFSFVESLEYQISQEQLETLFTYNESHTSFQIGVGIQVNLNKLGDAIF